VLIADELNAEIEQQADVDGGAEGGDGAA